MHFTMLFLECFASFQAGVGAGFFELEKIRIKFIIEHGIVDDQVF